MVAKGEPPKAAGPIAAIDLLQQGMEQSLVHFNVEQQMIVVTEDKLRLGLNDLLHAAKRRQAWHAPAGMFITEIAASATSSFHAAAGLSGEQWEALFWVLTLVTFVWLVGALIRGKREPSPDSLIHSLEVCQHPAGPRSIQVLHP